MKFLRHSVGDRPNLVLKCGRMADALAKPAAKAMFSMEQEVVSSRRWAWFKRSFRSHCAGDVPVCFEKRRETERSVVFMRWAMVSTVCLWSSVFRMSSSKLAKAWSRGRAAMGA